MMGLRYDIGNPWPRSAARPIAARRERRPFGGRGGAFLALAFLVLAGCSNGAGSLLIDPGRYNLYRCNDIPEQWKVLLAREKELRALIERADQSGGGAVIGSLAYRTDYETVLSEERLLQRTAAEQKCNFTPQFQSDQIIR